MPPWKPRFVEVRGTVEAFSEGGTAINVVSGPDMIRITPTFIVSLGVNEEGFRPGS